MEKEVHQMSNFYSKEIFILFVKNTVSSYTQTKHYLLKEKNQAENTTSYEH